MQEKRREGFQDEGQPEILPDKEVLLMHLRNWNNDEKK